MSLPLLPSILPLEVKSLIWVLLDDKILAKDHPEVFWAIAPDYLRFLTIGISFKSLDAVLQTGLVDIYPECGHLVERLTLMTDILSIDIINDFLQNFPTHRKLRHLCINLSPVALSLRFPTQLPYFQPLINLIAESPNMTRLSFENIQPHYELINAAPQLTRLDIGLIYPSEEETLVPLSSHIQILSITPSVVLYMTDPPPRTLHTLIIRPDSFTTSFLLEDLQYFIGQCSSLTNIALIDNCTSSFFYMFFLLI